MFPRIAFAILAAAALVAAVDWLILRRHRAPGVGRAGRWSKLVYFGTFVSFLVLAFTGFLPTIDPQVHLRGWLLIIHCLAAGPFAVGLALLALLWADHCRLCEIPSPFDRAQRLFFWLVAALGLIVIVTAVGGFSKWFGELGQDRLLFVHRSAALGLVVAMLGQLYLFTLGRPPRAAGPDRAAQRILGGAEVNW